MSEFTNVTVLKRANLYFDGKVCVVTYYCWSFLD